MFAAAGFDIVIPESLTFEDQLKVARRSGILAGCAGSQMYLAAFQPPGGQTAVLAPSNFLFPDDAIIADALDRRLFVAFGSPVRFGEPEMTWSIEPAGALRLLERLNAGTDR
jgi:capsular polysaccharide biosynthesis protein